MKYMIGIAALVFDPQGALLVPWNPDSETGTLTRRVNRVRTLDGGVSVTNRGYSPGDRTVTVSLDGLPPEKVEQARRMVRMHGHVTLTIADGAFNAALSDYSESSKTLTVLIIGTA